jgi:N6-adenosine-specific RNA methylase IME4
VGPVTFSTLVIDPPWPYSDRLMSGVRRTRGAANHYPTMALDALRALRPQDVAADNAHLYVWATNAFMVEAHELMRTWGFTQKTIVTWVKPHLGMGRYFRNCTEHVVFGVRGTCPTKLRNVRTWFEAPRRWHSAKPPEFYDIVERMSHGPYLELFARAERHGWVTVGDEIDGRSIGVALDALAAR